MRVLPLLFLVSTLSLLLLACSEDSQKEATPKREKPLVATTFYPTTYFAQRIGGDSVDVRCPLPEDADPIFWRPQDADLEFFISADLIIRNGASLERWMTSVSLPESRLVDSASRLKEPPIVILEAISHSHGGKGEHSHAGVDGHTWVDPVNAMSQVEVIRDALIRLVPERRNDYETRAIALNRDLQALRDSLSTATAAAAKAKTPILASHPAYNYLARRFGLAIENLNLSPEEMLSEDQRSQIRDLLQSHPARAILWESEPRADLAAELKQDFGLSSFVFSPCEMMTAADLNAGANYLSVMNTNLDHLRAALALP